MGRPKVVQPVEWRSDEFQEAAERIGTAPQDSLRWILDFAQTAPDGFSPGKWLDTANELGAVVDQAGSQSLPGREWCTWGEKFGVESDMTRPSRRDVIEQKAAVLEILTFLKVPATSQTFEIPIRLSSSPSDGRFEASISPSLNAPASRPFDPSKILTFRLALLLSQHGGEVRRCPDCQRFFLQDRTDQLYCSTLCLGRTTQRKWRESKELAKQKKSFRQAIEKTKRSERKKVKPGKPPRRKRKGKESRQ